MIAEMFRTQLPQSVPARHFALTSRVHRAPAATSASMWWWVRAWQLQTIITATFLDRGILA